MEKPLRNIDRMMWDVNMPTSLVTITGMMTFEKKLNIKFVKEIIHSRLFLFERFRMKVILKKNKPTWCEDELFDLEAHILQITLPNPGNYEQLQKIVSELISKPLDEKKPLWQAHIIQNYHGGSAIVWRLHHAIGDGIALVKVIFSLTGTTRMESLKIDTLPIEEGNFENQKHTIKEEVSQMIHTSKDLYHQGQELIKNPTQMKDALKESWNITKELGKLFFGPSVTNTIYKGQLSFSKKVAWSDALSLQDIKQIRLQHHATINDILLALITGAIRRHLIKHQQPLNRGIRIVVPVNMRKSNEKIKVHNKIGMLSIELPVHIKNVNERIAHIVEKTALLKNSIEPVLIYNLLHILADITPTNIERKFSNFIGTKIAGVVTNVPGPKTAIYFAGNQVKDIMFWVPQTSPLGIGVSIISYNNRVCLGITTDTNLVKDPDEIINGYYKEFEAMKKTLR